ncbi:MAG: UDP-N-acetylmuramoyl-L-alanine--D-glutamate ligase [Candidatus Omnitrophica bacterium]|nr:UDP-N-acetylmuramoyl-L-alanine--D-glutamate ligase [Candidatus Omnitrophota bacterium]
MDIKGKKITIIGGKRSGQAVARLIIAQEGIVFLSDQQGMTAYTKDFITWAQSHDVTFDMEGHDKSMIQKSDVVVLSPGVPVNAVVVDWARQADIPVLGEIEFSYQFCRAPVIAVTGSNGKTTVSTLTYQVLKSSGYNVQLCGNIGAPFADYVGQSSKLDYVVLELSSFQLESLLNADSKYFYPAGYKGLSFKGFCPHIAVFLNFSQNHLDRHKDLAEYFDAKRKIFRNQTKEQFAVLNAQDGSSGRLSGCLSSTIRYFNHSSSKKESDMKNPNFRTVRVVADIVGINHERCLDVFRRFKGVEHRMEFVRERNGVKYINDSKATTVASGRWALNNIHAPIIMICGGKDKNLDFTVIKVDIARQVKKIYVIGEAKDKIRRAYKDILNVVSCSSLEEAVSLASQTAREGDYVLFCPMCASFDMFDNFEHRGKVYKKIVTQLK